MKTFFVEGLFPKTIIVRSSESKLYDVIFSCFENSDVDVKDIFSNFYFISNGHLLSINNVLTDDLMCISCICRLNGGKQGAFSKTLKHQKNTGKKVTNVDRCRDLSGKRIKTLKNEEKADVYIKLRTERKINEEKEREREKRERIAKSKVSVDIGDFDDKMKKSVSLLSTTFQNNLTIGKKNKDQNEEDDDSDEDSSDDTNSLSSSSSSSSFSSSSSSSSSSSPSSTPFSSLSSPSSFPSSVSSSTSPSSSSPSSSSPSSSSFPSSPSSSSSSSPTSCSPLSPVDLTSYTSVAALQAACTRLQLRDTLTHYGLKTGGTDAELAQRLYSIRGQEKNPSAWDRKILAKK